MKRQWSWGNIVVGITFDVTKVFPLVLLEVLEREMRGRGSPEAVVLFVRSFMVGQVCCLLFEEVISKELNWRCGLPQSSPLSLILF